MPIEHKDFMALLTGDAPLKRKLSKLELERYSKGFEKAKGGEPANNGVPKEVGAQMIRAAARSAEKRLKKKKAD